MKLQGRLMQARFIEFLQIFAKKILYISNRPYIRYNNDNNNYYYSNNNNNNNI